MGLEGRRLTSMRTTGKGNIKTVILARGLATRMRAAASTPGLTPEQSRAAAAGLKAMMPVGAPGAESRPFLDYVLSALADAGLHDVGLVIGPEHNEMRERYTRDVMPSRLRLAWLVQPEAKGTADAVLAAEAWVGDDDFLVMNADNLYPVEALVALRCASGPALLVFERDDLIRHSNIPTERLASFALLRATPDGRLTAIVEKPGAAAMDAAGPKALVSMNCWRFDHRMFACCRDVPLSSRGEYELPGAVQLALERGLPFDCIPASGEILDLSRRDDVQGVSTRLAGRIPRL